MSHQAFRGLSVATTVIEQELTGTDAFQGLAILHEKRVNGASNAESGIAAFRSYCAFCV
jgi:hypothetical protein